MQQELLDIQSRLKKTIIFITHDINEAFKLGDRVAIMKDGIIEQIGTPDEILAAPKNDYIQKFVQDIDQRFSFVWLSGGVAFFLGSVLLGKFLLKK